MMHLKLCTCKMARFSVSRIEAALYEHLVDILDGEKNPTHKEIFEPCDSVRHKNDGATTLTQSKAYFHG